MRTEPYRILGISSGRDLGNAEILLRECLMECEKLADVDVRIVRLRGLNIRECDGCLKCLADAACGGNGECHIQDEFQWLKDQILWADAIILSSPCYVYVPTSEVFTLMNRAMGSGRDYMNACRAKPKLVGLIAACGSDTVDYHLPLQYYAMHSMCHGAELVDQFYANWVRGRGAVAYQDHLLARSRLQAKRIVNRLKGYPVPANNVRILKLNPMEKADDAYVELSACPVCQSAVVQMENEIFSLGKFKCTVCGAEGHVEHHAGELSYVWDDDTVAHNRLHADHDQQYIDAYAAAHKPVEGQKAEVKEFPVLTQDNDPAPEKPRIIALVAGPAGGTSELLARKALEQVTAPGVFEGAIIRLNDLKIHFCTGCLHCKIDARYRGGSGECVLQHDDDLWIVDKLLQSRGAVFSLDGVNGFTYGKAVSLMQRFGTAARTKKAGTYPRPYITMTSAFDDQPYNAAYVPLQWWRHFCNWGPGVAQEFFTNVPTVGDGILANADALARAERAGKLLASAAKRVMEDPESAPLIKEYTGMCPSCKFNMIELHPDMTVSCAMCDAHGKFQHIFGEEDIVWDEYSVLHSRATAAGKRLHFKHINYSQSEENEISTNPKIIAEKLAPYVEYGKLTAPSKT